MAYGDDAEPAAGKARAQDSLSDEASHIKDVLEKYQRGTEHDSENIEKAIDDLKFLDGQDDAQWDEKAKNERNTDGRPCLTINTLPQFVHQVTGDMRMMRPAIKVVAADKDARDAKAEEIYANMIRYIENRSTAKAAYANATDSQVAAGIGHIQVVTEYADESSMNLELGITAVQDGVNVIWDPEAVKPAREDAMWCFVPVDISRKTFEKKWPDKSPKEIGGTTYQADGWYGDDFIRVAAYWYKKPIKRTLAVFPDGRVDDLTDSKGETPEEKAQYETVLAALPAMGARIEERDGYQIIRELITCSDVLERTEWKGRYIPIVPVIGEEIRIGRKITRKGIVRNAKDVQRLYNYFHSAHAEAIALQPKSPYLSTQVNVEDYPDIWQNANKKNYSTLIYKADPANGGIPPQRVQPAVSSQGISEGIALASENMKRVIGIYDAGLGAKSNETSGKAIMARQREGDIGTYLYVQNFQIALQQIGRILVDLIPHIYDTDRVIRVQGEDGKIDTVRINETQTDGVTDSILNDVTVGTYDVILDSGPSFTTRREETREMLTELIRSSPDAAPLIMDQVVELLGLPNGDKIGKRFRAMLPEEIKKAEEAEQAEQNGQQMPGQMPQQQQADPAQMMQQQAQQMQFEAGAAELQFKVQEAEAKAKKAQADAAKAETELQIKQVELAKAQRDFMNPPTPQEMAQPQ